MMKRFLKSFRYGNKGFTLIELLIVVAILGVLAALIIPNVSQFLESGRVGAGRAERSTLQVAVDGMMADAGCTALDAAVAGWQGEAGKALATSSSVPPVTYDANSYIRRFPTEGTYSVSNTAPTIGVVTCTAYGTLDADAIARINE